MYKDLLATVAVVAAMAGAPMIASAADSTSSVTVKTEAHEGMTLSEAKSDDAVVKKFDLTVGKIKGKDVKNADGTIGEVDKVLVNKEGEVAGVTVDVGGFLGVGVKEVMVGLDQLALNDGDFMTTFTKDELKSMPEYKD